MSLVLAILGAIPAIYGIIKFIEEATKENPAQEIKNVVANTDAALNKADKTNDTSSIEDMFNK